MTSNGWCRSCRYIDRLKGSPFVVVDYDLLMEDAKKQLHRIASGLDLHIDKSIEASVRTYAEEFATKDLYHHRHDPKALLEREELNPLAVSTYHLAPSAGDRQDINADAEELWSALADLQERFEAMAPVLRYVDFLEEEVKQRYFGLAGFWQKVLPRIGSSGKKSARRVG